MNDDQLLRFSRQIMLPEVDVAGQEALLAAHVAIIGVGGLGSPAALYLAASGIGELTLVDDDVVDHTNLQRQIAHTEARIGQPKVASAAESVRALNAGIRLNLVDRRLDSEAALAELCHAADVIVDATDNFSSRYAMNRAALAARTPTVSAAAIRFDGQLTVFDPRRADSPCYRCLYPQGSDTALNCAENGVIAPLVGVIGCLQALEVIKLVTGAGTPLVGRLQVFDGRTSEWQTFRLPRNPDCEDCGAMLT